MPMPYFCMKAAGRIDGHVPSLLHFRRRRRTKAPLTLGMIIFPLILARKWLRDFPWSAVACMSRELLRSCVIELLPPSLLRFGLPSLFILLCCRGSRYGVRCGGEVMISWLFILYSFSVNRPGCSRLPVPFTVARTRRVRVVGLLRPDRFGRRRSSASGARPLPGPRTSPMRISH